MGRVISLTPRERRWLTVMGWLVGLALFVRLTQVLPCCQPPSMEQALRTPGCRSGLEPCPRYDDCAPR